MTKELISKKKVSDSHIIGEDEAKQIFSSYGIPVVKEKKVTNNTIYEINAPIIKKDSTNWPPSSRT